MKNILVCAVLVGVVFHQHLQNHKLKLERDRYKSLFETVYRTNEMRQDLFKSMETKYLAWEKKYKHLREQNYILTRKFRKTDTPAYRKYLAGLIKKAAGTGGDKVTDCENTNNIFSWPNLERKKNSILKVTKASTETCTTSSSTDRPTPMPASSM